LSGERPGRREGGASEGGEEEREGFHLGWGKGANFQE
jgi:hypothetical protein